jgi:hypothetical protein
MRSFRFTSRQAHAEAILRGALLDGKWHERDPIVTAVMAITGCRRRSFWQLPKKKAAPEGTAP